MGKQGIVLEDRIDRPAIGAGMSFESSPKIRMWPSFGLSKPEISLRQVVFPRTRWAQHREERPFLDAEIDPVDRGDGSEAPRNVLEFDSDGHLETHLRKAARPVQRRAGH